MVSRIQSALMRAGNAARRHNSGRQETPGGNDKSHIAARTRNGSATPTPPAILVSRIVNVSVTSVPEGTKRIPLGPTRSSSKIIQTVRSAKGSVP